jgi:aldose 1-epimerase
MRVGLCMGVLLAAASICEAGIVTPSVDPSTGRPIVTLSQGDTTVRILPAAGFNVYSLKFGVNEFLRQPDTLRDLKGFMYGTPIMYPTPNRVRDSKLTFDGVEYQFEPNNGPNFLHGLVHSAPFKITHIKEDSESASVTAELVFQKGTPWFEKFPFEHKLIVQVTVRDTSVRWTYTVDNTQGAKPVPYGFGLHPWFLYHGDRADTTLSVPASGLMESKELLPTGNILSLDNSPSDARQPRSLQDFVVDDVYYGMRPETPAIINFKDAMFELGLYATQDFTHMVVYTPLEPWFCVENQTCSTDAHNLYAQGKTQESNLLVVNPGSKTSGWVEYRYKEYARIEQD